MATVDLMQVLIIGGMVWAIVSGLLFAFVGVHMLVDMHRNKDKPGFHSMAGFIPFILPPEPPKDRDAAS